LGAEAGVKLTTGTGISTGSMALNYSSATNRATLTFPGLSGQKLPDGRYKLTVSRAGIADANGNQLIADFDFTFHALTGDANGDAVVNDRDLYLVWQNLLKPAASRNLNEDLTGDGQVTSVQADPAPDNVRAIRCYRNVGFRPVAEVDTPDGRALLMICGRSASAVDEASSRISSRPVFSGMRLSTTSRSKGRLASSRWASRAPPAATTSWPSSRSARPRALRIFSSSSTSRMEPRCVTINAARPPWED